MGVCCRQVSRDLSLEICLLRPAGPNLLSLPFDPFSPALLLAPCTSTAPAQACSAQGGVQGLIFPSRTGATAVWPALVCGPRESDSHHGFPPGKE